ncbi:hypothetical protein GLOIN_2v1783829 [Rhizophagus irregularis DAOM 181602=DAOM 197198]|uniref:Endonuclease/exonuclease/phosphatase domain-containing protein n=1 Tax=Rhizophagus irregularis (strain DAOM 181602 / DAOM 197198 / MUCL 43194) TaxID=747089 RepID=A0A2P4PE20_RHIID|nr:hypothetical protein GLOIN_2v1783829 [Rhizophagus irregularis DAOM 181602=DAOM 197198]POG63621.1 hypothetical protein GLOIN_2v1783829 [Rhizophagus irregularis DAOM 181602=DAOM 197198]|eukprot:XP_025170487.1 hypothetical protein GLOIN_2v1783829 [Rhizophagus irregularis DAOM 181602=DAOM 197198]
MTHDQLSQISGQPVISPPSQQGSSILPEDVAALRQQILDLSIMIRDLDARVDWFSTQLVDHSFRIEKLEAAYQPDLWYESHEDMNNWDNPSSAPPPEQQSSLPNVLMHLSPDTSFSYDENSTILPFRHQDPIPADSSDRINFYNNSSSSFPFHISPSAHSTDLFSSNILQLESLNVRSLFTHSSTTNHHSGVGVILHSSLAMYIVKKKFFSDRLIGLTLQLPGKCNVLLIGGYIPPISSLNQSTIADCHSTLISWIRSAQSSNHNVLLGGYLNADFDSFLTSGSLSWLDYIWISPSFSIPHLWSSVSDLTDIFSTDHFLITAHFDFLAFREQHVPSLYILIVDVPDGLRLLVAPEEIKDAVISHFQNIVGPSVSLFDSLSSLPPRWQKRYSPLEQFSESLYDSVMSHISISELREVISASPAHKASGPSSIPYEWFKLLSDTSLQFLCELMNRCLDLSDIPEDWRSASITPILKSHEFDALLKNTRPITLLETAQKLLVKIINN